MINILAAASLDLNEAWNLSWGEGIQFILVLAFVYWLLAPMPYDTPFELFEDPESWFDEWYQVFAFAVAVACYCGFFFFKDE